MTVGPQPSETVYCRSTDRLSSIIPQMHRYGILFISYLKFKFQTKYMQEYLIQCILDECSDKEHTYIIAIKCLRIFYERGTPH